MDLMIVDEVGTASLSVGIARFSRLTATVRDLVRARAELYWEASRERAIGDGTVAERGFGILFDRGDTREAIAAAAEQAFVAGQYFLLLDDRQALSLDEEIDLTRTGTATFLLVTPLKGG